MDAQFYVKNAHWQGVTRSRTLALMEVRREFRYHLPNEFVVPTASECRRLRRRLLRGMRLRRGRLRIRGAWPGAVRMRRDHGGSLLMYMLDPPEL